MAVIALFLSLVALSYQELAAWELACALLAPAAAVAVLGRYPLVSLAVCVAASTATATALRDAVPVWSVELSAALFVICFLAGRRMQRPGPALGVLAAGAAVQVRVVTTQVETTLTVVNALPLSPRRGRGAGAGLAGLRERARLVGGTLDAGTRGRSFEIVATLPHHRGS